MTKTPSEESANKDFQSTLAISLMGKDISQIQKDMTAISTDVKEIKNGRFISEDTLMKKLAETKKEIADEFEPIERLVYGLVGLILIAVVGGLLRLVVK